MKGKGGVCYPSIQQRDLGKPLGYPRQIQELPRSNYVTPRRILSTLRNVTSSGLYSIWTILLEYIALSPSTRRHLRTDSGYGKQRRPRLFRREFGEDVRRANAVQQIHTRRSSSKLAQYNRFVDKKNSFHLSDNSKQNRYFQSILEICNTRWHLVTKLNKSQFAWSVGKHVAIDCIKYNFHNTFVKARRSCKDFAESNSRPLSQHYSWVPAPNLDRALAPSSVGSFYCLTQELVIQLNFSSASAQAAPPLLPLLTLLLTFCQVYRWAVHAKSLGCTLGSRQ